MLFMRALRYAALALHCPHGIDPRTARRGAVPFGVLIVLLGTQFIAAGAAAQSGSECESAASFCNAGCAATGALGSLLGGGGGAAQQCRALCNERRLECERQGASAAPAQSASPEAAPATAAAPPGRAQREPPPAVGDPAAAGGEAVVLMTVKPKDPFSPTLVSMPVTYIHQALSAEDARRHMRPKWTGPARQHHAEAGTVLAVYGGPVMTRQKFVDATLAAYEKQGGKRGNVRIDVLSEGARDDSRRADTGQGASRSRAAQAASATPAARSSSSDRDCVKQWSSPRVDQRGNRSYFFVRNDCGGPVTLALSKSRAGQTAACYPGVVPPGAENEFSLGVHAMCLHPASVSPDQAVSTQDVHCKCPAGAKFIPAGIFNAPAGGGTVK